MRRILLILAVVLVMAAMTVMTTAGTGFAKGPPNPGGQCPPGNTPGCSPHR